MRRAGRRWCRFFNEAKEVEEVNEVEEVKEVEEAKEVEEKGSRSSITAILTGSRRTASGKRLARFQNSHR